VDEVLVRKVAETLSLHAGSAAFLGASPENVCEQESWKDHARAALTAVEQVLLCNDTVLRAASDLSEEALNLLGRDLGTMHVEQLVRKTLLSALGTDEASVYDRHLKSPLSAEAIKGIRQALAEGRVPRRKVPRREEEAQGAAFQEMVQLDEELGLYDK
jgi:hypothetical protein